MRAISLQLMLPAIALLTYCTHNYGSILAGRGMTILVNALQRERQHVFMFLHLMLLQHFSHKRWPRLFGTRRCAVTYMTPISPAMRTDDARALRKFSYAPAPALLYTFIMC